MSLGSLQTMVGSLPVSPLNAQRSTHTSQKAASYGQRLLPHGHFHKGQVSKNDIMNASTSDERLLNNKTLIQLLTSSNYSPSQQPERHIQRLPDTFDCTMASARPSGNRPSLDDDQILHRIENKLKMFRARMKALKGRGSSDALNSKASGSPQGSSPVTPSASGAVVKAAVNITVRSVRDEGHSVRQKKKNPGKTRLDGAPEGTRLEGAPEGTRLEGAPEGTRLEGAPEGTRLDGAPTDKHFTEPDQIITAAVRSNMEDKKDYSKGFRALFSSPLGELVTETLDCTVHHKPPNHEQSGAENDHSTLKDVVKGVDDPATIADSTPPKLLARTTLNQQPFGIDSDNKTSHTVETSSAGRENLPLNSCQICNVNKVPDVASSVANYQQIIEPEPQRKELTGVEIGVQAGDGRIEMDQWDQAGDGRVEMDQWDQLSVLRDPRFEDITDDETDVTQVSTHVNKTQISVFTQSPKHVPNVKTSTNATSEPAERPTPKRQEPKAPLTCSCPYLVQTNDGFEEVPCPKCAQEVPFTKREEESEESDSEEVILFVTDLVLKEEVMVLGSSDEEEENVSSAEQQNQYTVIERVEEFDTFDSFVQSKIYKNLPNPLVATGARPGAPAEPPLCHLPLDSEQVLPHCSSQNAAEKVSKIAPAPKLLGIFERFSHELQTPCCSEDISSDAGDGSDYPSHTQFSHLVRAQCPQPHDCRKEHEEALQSSPEMTSDTVLTPDNDNEPEKNAINHPTAGPLERIDGSKTQFKKAKYKSRHVRAHDSEPESDQDGGETRCFSAKNGVALTRPDVGPVKFGQNSFSGLQRFEKSSPISSNLDYDGEGDQVHNKVLNNVDQKTASKRKNKTDPKSDTQVKRKMPSLDVGKEQAQIMAKQASGSSINAPNANPNLAIEPKGNLVSRRHSLSHQRPVEMNLYLEGEQYLASSLPLQTHSQPASNLIRKTRPTPQSNTENLNSYSTEKPAMQAVFKVWSGQHISIRKERRSSYEPERSRMPQNVKTKHCAPKPRKRHNSQPLPPPLMKRSKLQAQKLTKDAHQKESTMPNQADVGESYKWKEKRPTKDRIDDGWLDRMHGEPFQRPHF